jgi:hypothetical protein
MSQINAVCGSVVQPVFLPQYVLMVLQQGQVIQLVFTTDREVSQMLYAMFICIQAVQIQLAQHLISVLVYVVQTVVCTD